MLRNIHLKGDLAAFCGQETFTFDVSSVGEALRALESNFKGFMQKIKRKGEYRVVVGNVFNDAKKHLNNETIRLDYNDNKDIWIAPVIAGSKQAGVWQTVLGIVLIVVGIIVPAIGVYTIPVGIGLLISGVVQMLTPTPKVGDYGDREDANNRQSTMFDGPVNTVGQGGSIPDVYGRVRIGSTIISAGLESEDA